MPADGRWDLIWRLKGQMPISVVYMPMEMFVICVGDLATVGGSVVVVTPVRSLPGYSFYLGGGGSARPWGLEGFYPGGSLA